MLKNPTIFNNGRYTTNITTDPHTGTCQSLIKKMSDIYNRMELLSEGVGKNSVNIKAISDKIKNIVVGNDVSYSNIVKSSAGIHSRNASQLHSCCLAGFLHADHPNTVFLHVVCPHVAHSQAIHIHVFSVSTTWIL